MEFFSDIWKLTYISQLNIIHDPTEGNYWVNNTLYSVFPKNKIIPLNNHRMVICEYFLFFFFALVLCSYLSFTLFLPFLGYGVTHTHFN